LNFTKTRESGFLRFWHLKTSPPAGASLLAMDAQATHLSSQHALSFNSIASKLAPTKSHEGAFEKQYRLSLLQDFAMRQ
jgi:hypothetical protein